MRNFGKILVNLALALALFIGFILFGIWALRLITHHGQYEKVPTVTGKSYDKARALLASKGFPSEVQDSIWDETLAPLTVVRQAPAGDAMVKAQRRIFLTVNRGQPPLVEIPNFVGLSFRNAELFLKQLGLKLGDTLRKPDIARDAVLEQMYQDNSLKPGTKLFQGSAISFVLGSGLGNQDLAVPGLVGLHYREAKARLNSLGLNVGALIVDGNVKDTAEAFVYRQNPETNSSTPDGGSQSNKIRAGQGIDLWLSRTAPGSNN